MTRLTGYQPRRADIVCTPIADTAASMIGGVETSCSTGGAGECLPGTLAHIAEAFSCKRSVRRADPAAGRRARAECPRPCVNKISRCAHTYCPCERRELQRLIEERERRVAAMEPQLREETLRARKLQASKDAAETRARALLQDLHKQRER